MEAFEYEGTFWDCEKPENTAVGTVRFIPQDGITLKVFGTFSDINNDFSSLATPVRRIHGVANRAFMTLVGCQSTNVRAESPGIAREEFRVNCILRGHTLPQMMNCNLTRLPPLTISCRAGQTGPALR